MHISTSKTAFGHFWPSVQAGLLACLRLRPVVSYLQRPCAPALWGGRMAALAGAYVLSAVWGHQVGLPIAGGCLVWPLAGLGLGALLLGGIRLWPALFLAGLAAQLLLLRQAGGSPASLIAVAGAALGGTLEALVACGLIQRFAGGRAAFGHPQTVLLFAGLGGCLGAVVGATLGVAGVLAAGTLGASAPGWLWVSWWMNDLTGMVVVTPLFLVWGGPPPVLQRVGRWAEILALALSLALACVFVFDGWGTGKGIAAPQVILLAILLLWAALRWGLRGTTLAVLGVAVVCLVSTLHLRGPFIIGGLPASMLLAQECVVILGVMSLVLAADVLKRRESEAQTRHSEARYRELFRDNPQPMMVYDLETCSFVGVNDAALRLYGFERAEFFKLGVRNLLPFSERAQAPEGERANWGSQKEGLVCQRHRRKDGALIDVELSWHTLATGGGPAVMFMVSDLTQRKQAEQRAVAFSNLGRRLSAAASTEAAAWIIAETAQSLFGWEGFSFDVSDAASQQFVRALWLENVEGTYRRVRGREPFFETLASGRRVLQHGAQLVLRTRSPEPGPVRTGKPADTVIQPVSLMVVPLRSRTQTLAVISIQSGQLDAYTQADLWVLQALADHCVGALERLQAQTLCREKEDCLHLALAAGKMGTWAFELEGRRRILLSPELGTILELGENELALSEEELMKRVHPRDRSRLAAVLAAVEENRTEYEVEFRFLAANRPPVWVLARGQLCCESAERSPHLVGIAVDITERRQAELQIRQLNDHLEQRVRARTVQLEAANHELEAFSYSVSHDLRAPLRSIQGFSQVVLDRYSPFLDERGREFLRRICESSQHMNALIEDLLKLSRVGRAELRQEQVDLSGLASSIAAELNEAEPQRKVEWLIAPQLTVRGDARLLRVALENLLRNAWKFTAHQALPRIEVGFQGGEKPAFFVRDNGAGFDMNLVHRLFGVFQRLHSTSEFPGTGVGLATVQRIIHRHGGQVWAAGVVNQGAAFFFTVPSLGAV